MMFEEGYVLDLAIRFGFLSITAAMALAFVRLVLGKSLPDRVVALDLITMLAVAFCALFAISADHAAFVDVAISLALVAFLATVAFARFAERRAQERPLQKTGRSGK
ncbi:MAG: multicomponent Na+:H+ antiporter subunit F [Paracoccaceae bacterium]|jgi:multicomponent Na+:H+ antiporter subunit F